MAGLRFKEIARTLVAIVALPTGLVAYKLTGKTSARTYQAFVWLFCLLGGRLNTALSWVVSLRHPPVPIERPVGVLGDLSGVACGPIEESLRRDGYVLFERALSEQACDRLLEFARSTPTTLRRMDAEARGLQDRTALFSGANPSAVRYDYDTSALLDNADVQTLLADRSLLHLAQEYLECQPVADVLSMWWHTNYHAQPDSEAAQFYHFDMDRIKWLKVFIYLTDVGPENGPHSFVAGSHREDGIPWDLRRKGYVRLTDDEVIQHYGKARCLSMTAPRGSIIVEDTAGFHKGNTVVEDSRLVLQLQFSNSLFGAYYPPAKISRISSLEFGQRLREHPTVYRQYVDANGLRS